MPLWCHAVAIKFHDPCLLVGDVSLGDSYVSLRFHQMLELYRTIHVS